MSFELDYFPPSGTRWQWHPKTLNYSPWYCNFSKQREPELNLWPMSINLQVDRKGEKWVWIVDVINFQHERSHVRGEAGTSLEACLAAEAAGQTLLNDLLPDWARTALENKWRPPATR
mgnify:CR=1 FL=1